MPLTGRTFRAVLFDNDGTLVDSMPAAARAWVQWADEHDVPRSALEGIAGMPAAAIIAKVAPGVEPVAALARIEELELRDTADVVALPGAVEAVEATRDRCAIVTSATGDLAAARLSAAGIPTPTRLVTADDITRGKPDPEPFLIAARLLGVEPDQCLVVEDAPNGLTAARAAGCATLALTTSHTAHELDADLVVASLADVVFESTSAGLRVRVVEPS
ncbi:HAD-IA family hydrolase [Allobranchiibius huperziae]|uniref:Sugar-phosphatase n=1 Tax=Allobranchiibius huperziae TaxID=1874116 RepID=A0A853DMB6_9MICO|nr:HAD-IA family hydrolase [Allobranchiibius huperziae]NYJ75770.1 sugar-phosphatase [Allobranchiibius huperziae]